MFCKWCGLESETSDVCSWCRKPFSAAAAAQERAAQEKSATDDSAAPDGAVNAFDDFDDLSPLPFGGAPAPFAQPPAPRSTPSPVPAPAAAPPSQPAAPPIVSPPPVRRTGAPPAYVPPIPPVSPGRGGPGYTPAQPRQPADDRPALEPIPIRKPGGPGTALPIIPIQRPAAPATPPPTVAPPPAPKPSPLVIPLAGAAPPQAAPSTPLPSAAVPLAPIDEPPTPTDQPPARPVSEAPPAPLIVPSEPEDLDLPPLVDEPEDSRSLAPGRLLDLADVSPAPQVQARPAAPPPPPFGRTATMAPPAPRPGARTYYCRACGMESDTPDTCSWCRRDMRNLPQASGHHIVTTRSTRGPKRGPVRQRNVQPVVAPRSAPPTGSNGGHLAPAVPQLGTFTAQKSKYYSDKVMDPVSGAHYDADTGEAEIEDIAPIETVEVNPLVQVAVNVGVLAAIAIISGIAVHVQAGLYLAVLAVSNFAAGLAMPLLRTVPFGEDDSDDVALFLGCTLILGPFVGAILFAVIGFAKGNANPAIVGIYVSYLTIRIAMIVGAGQDFRTVLPFFDTHWQILVAQALPLVTMAGWYAAGMFHKPDE